jgi:hypothetical protein
MQRLLAEVDQDMPVRKDTKEEIARELQAQLALALESLKPKGIRKLLHWIIEWGLSSVAIMLPITLLGITLAAVYYSISGVRENSEFRAHTNDRLDAIESQVRLLLAPQAPSTVLKEMGSLNQKAFSMSLPALRKVSELPATRVRADPETVREIAFRLRTTNDSSPDYWPTVLQFIQFASAALTPPTDIPPPGTASFQAHDMDCRSGPNGKPCVIISHRIVLLDGGSVPNSIFDHCRIQFTEKPVNLSGVTFTNCLFEMPTSAGPSPYLQNVTKILLASNLSRVSFPKS